MARVKTSTLFFALYVILLSFHYVKSSRFEGIKNDLKESRKLKEDAVDALDAVFSDSHAEYNKNLNNIKDIAKSGDSSVAKYAKKLERKLEDAARDGFSSSV
ncbi:hypothetical protein HNY73_002002 [Argiope bruennichi]|uniref:Uncharacterized protein n=1 Tax=Argiope bruennichi TaxID=94029 RepID=A0A8T0FT80_ARGBR|nr:hypothetical protein HNY73_002002 [Argiope bruennichi]